MLDDAFRLFLFFYPAFLVLDLISCVLDVRETYRGRGPSGFPIVFGLIYVLVILSLRKEPWAVRLIAALLGALAHLFITVAIPYWYARRKRPN